MEREATRRHTGLDRVRWAAAGMLLVLVGCGGGGGTSPPAPPAAPNITIAAGGTVVSSDGKLTLEVDANTASASVVAALTKATPDAAAAADPTLVADSSYTYSGTDLTFSSPAVLALSSTQTSGSSSRAHALATGDMHALGAKAYPSETWRLCEPVYAAQWGLEPRVTWTHLDACPATCTQREGLGTHLLRCEPPDQWIYVVPESQACYVNSIDVTIDPALADYASLFNVRFCELQPQVAAPVIAKVPGTPLGGCAFHAGRYLCNVSQLLNNGAYSIFKDSTPPNAAIIAVVTTPDDIVKHAGGSAYTVKVAEGGSQAFQVAVGADATAEPVGLRQLELLEIALPSLPPIFEAGRFLVASTVVWSAVPAGQSLPAGTKTISPSVANAVTLNYNSSDATERRFFVRATDWSGNVKNSLIVRVARAAPTGPTIASFGANPATLSEAGGSVTLAWAITDATSASISPGVGDVNAVSGSVSVAVTQTATFTLSAANAAGQAAPQVVTVTVAADTTAPQVSLAASSQNVVAPGTTTLTATASDNLGVSKVEFYEGATLLATRNAPPHTLDVAYTAANIGSHGYTAKAYDAANNAGTSAALAVTVTLPSSADRFVDAASGLDTHDGLSAATPYKTLNQAMATVGSGGTVWLANGTYTAASEGFANAGSNVTVPVGRTVRAATDGSATLNFGLAFAGDGGAIGLVFTGPSVGYPMTGIDASAGTVTLSRLQFSNLGDLISGGGGVNARAALRVHGTAVVTLDNGAGNPLTFGAGIGNGVLAFDSAKVTVTGGRVETGNVAGCSTRCVARIYSRDSAGVVFDGVNIAIGSDSASAAQPFVLSYDASKVTIRNASVAQAANNTSYRDLAWPFDNASFTLVNSTVGATFRYVAWVPNTNVTGVPTIAFDGVAVNGGVTRAVIGASAVANVAVHNSSFAGTTTASYAAVDMNAGGNLDVAGGSFANNKLGAIRLQGTADYLLKVRGASFANNGIGARPSYFTVSLAGGAGSVFDLGTAADPGNNTFLGTATGTALRVAANAAMTVDAVGNLWPANTQNTDGAGHYLLGAAPCGASTCTVTSGTGINYTVLTGTLRLAGN